MSREQGRCRFGGRGRSSGRRGGRFTPRGGSNRPTNQNAQVKEMKFTPHGQGKPQAATYASVKDAIIQYIQKTFKGGNDIAISIDQMKVVDLKSKKP